jgi:hypothetical protein
MASPGPTINDSLITKGRHYFIAARSNKLLEETANSSASLVSNALRAILGFGVSHTL